MDPTFHFISWAGFGLHGLGFGASRTVVWLPQVVWTQWCQNALGFNPRGLAQTQLRPGRRRPAESDRRLQFVHPSPPGTELPAVQPASRYDLHAGGVRLNELSDSAADRVWLRGWDR